MIRTIVLLFTVLILGACHSNSQPPLIATEIAAEKPGELPVKAFASLPLIEQLTLSPDGKHSAFLQNTDGETFLVTQNLNNQDSHVILKNNNDKSMIRHFAWVNKAVRRNNQRALRRHEISNIRRNTLLRPTRAESVIGYDFKDNVGEPLMSSQDKGE